MMQRLGKYQRRGRTAVKSIDADQSEWTKEIPVLLRRWGRACGFPMQGQKHKK